MVSSRSRAIAARGQLAARERLAGSSIDHLWRRLNAVDFINRGMLLAAVLLLCFIPFMIVFQALVGRDAVTSATRRFGLSHTAASDLSQVLTSPTSTSNAVTGLSYLLFVLGGLAAAAAIQDLYEQVF